MSSLPAHEAHAWDDSAIVRAFNRAMETHAARTSAAGRLAVGTSDGTYASYLQQLAQRAAILAEAGRSAQAGQRDSDGVSGAPRMTTGGDAVDDTGEDDSEGDGDYGEGDDYNDTAGGADDDDDFAEEDLIAAERRRLARAQADIAAAFAESATRTEAVGDDDDAYAASFAAADAAGALDGRPSNDAGRVSDPAQATAGDSAAVTAASAHRHTGAADGQPNPTGRPHPTTAPSAMLPRAVARGKRRRESEGDATAPSSNSNVAVEQLKKGTADAAAGLASAEGGWAVAAVEVAAAAASDAAAAAVRAALTRASPPPNAQRRPASASTTADGAAASPVSSLSRVLQSWFWAAYYAGRYDEATGNVEPERGMAAQYAAAAAAAASEAGRHWARER